MEYASYVFQSTSLVRGTTHNPGFMWRMADISIHVPRERDDWMVDSKASTTRISIHVPRERDDRPRSRWCGRSGPISIHVPRERDDGFPFLWGWQSRRISIHVPRERDDKGPLRHPLFQHISIHVPRERDDHKGGLPAAQRLLFQSTSLVRGTTACARSTVWATPMISIHVPRERDDISAECAPSRATRFQSTSLVRGTTRRGRA